MEIKEYTRCRAVNEPNDLEQRLFELGSFICRRVRAQVRTQFEFENFVQTCLFICRLIHEFVHERK